MPVQSEFPKLLVATHFPPNGSGGGAAVVRQMLKDWPVERLYWWSCAHDTDPRFGQRVAAQRTAAIPEKMYPQRRWRALRAGLMANVWTPWATHHFRKTVERFQPDVIWVIPVGWAIPPVAKVLLPGSTGFHVTVQDYPDAGNWVRQFGATHTRRFANYSDLLYSHSTTRDATSHPMIADLLQRTGSNAAQMMHAGLEKEDFRYIESKSSGLSDSIRLGFAGTITWEQDFARLIQAIVSIRSQLAKPVSLEIFSSHTYRDRHWFDSSWMHERGNLPEPHFTDAMRECTWGYGMMSLQENNRSHWFSFPTKFISYLAAGLPIFSIGHSESSLIKMAEQYHVGVWSASVDPAVLRAKALEAFSLEDPWKKFRSEIVRCAREEFDADQRRRILYDCFRECARKTAVQRGGARTG